MKAKLFTCLILVIFIFFVVLTNTVLAFQQSSGGAPGQAKKQAIEAVVGRIKDVKPGKIEVNSQGKVIEINTGKNPPIVEKPSGKKLNPAQLKKNDQIATIATSGAVASTSPRFVLIKPATAAASTRPMRRAVYGLVREITGNILTVSHPIKDNPRYKVQAIDTTVIKIKGLASPTVANIKVGDRVAAVGNWSDDILIAKRIHVIPGKAIGLFKKIGTPSATISAIPSPTSTPSATATPSASPEPTATP